MPTSKRTLLGRKRNGASRLGLLWDFEFGLAGFNLCIGTIRKDAVAETAICRVVILSNLDSVAGQKLDRDGAIRVIRRMENRDVVLDRRFACCLSHVCHGPVAGF